MTSPIIRFFFETAGGTSDLYEAPGNWLEFLSGDAMYFASEESTGTFIKEVTRPSSGEKIVPQLRVTQSAIGKPDETVPIPNYGKGGINGRYVLAIKFEDPDSGISNIVDLPRLEAWDSVGDMDTFTAPEHEVISGTEGNSNRSFLRAYDTTELVKNPNGDILNPIDGWWNSSISSTGQFNNKQLSGETSFLKALQTISTPDGELTPSLSNGDQSDVWYVSLAMVVPEDARKGMSGHGFILAVRTFFA